MGMDSKLKSTPRLGPTDTVEELLIGTEILSTRRKILTTDYADDRRCRSAEKKICVNLCHLWFPLVCLSVQLRSLGSNGDGFKVEEHTGARPDWHRKGASDGH